MSTSAPHFDRFARILHQRFVLLRGAERIGLSLLIGCGGALILMPILWWRGSSTLPAVLLTLTISTAIGLVMTLLRRPTPLDAIMLADRQLNLADLLGTAWSIQRSPTAPTDPWKITLLALADAKCRRLSASNVLLARWTSRRWGGVGLAMTLVLMLAVLSGQSTHTQADTGAIQWLSQSDSLGAPAQISRSVADATALHSSAHRPSHDPEDSSAGSPPEQTIVATDSAKTDSFDLAGDNRRPPSAGDPNGSGAGASGTSGVKSTIPQGNETSRNRLASRQGPTAGDGQSANHSDNADNATPLANGLSGAENGSSAVPPWQNHGWSSDQQRAGDLIGSRPTYDPYRNLIRDYFEHE